MKKVLTSALVLGAFCGVANATEITGPTYMPKRGDIVNYLTFVRHISSLNNKDSLRIIDRALYISDSGKVAVRDNLALNYGFTFDFKRKEAGFFTDIEEPSASFYDRYFGLTSRVYSNNANKFDIIFNVGQVDTPYADLSARYGLELSKYNLAFSLGATYYGTDKVKNEYREQTKIQYYLKLENELVVAENITFDFNFTYKKDRGSEVKIYDPADKWTVKGADVYTLYTGFNYELNKNNYLGLYYERAMSHGAKEIPNTTTQNFGFKLTSQF